jgi:hypothetical protein
MVEKREMGLFEVPNPLGHAGDDSACGLGFQDPVLTIALRLCPNWHQARRAIGQHPIGPILIFQGKSAPQFDGVDAKPLENVVVDSSQLLNRVVNANEPAWQPQEFTQAHVRHSGDAGGTMARQINRNTIRFPVME